MGKKIKKILITTGVVTLMLGSLVGNTSKVPSFGGITAYASEVTSQSNRWEGNGDSWKLRTADGIGYVSNSWFQDLDGSWYMIDSNGTMLSGLITDQSTGKTYMMNVNHDGTFGRMLVVDGAYNINGINVYLSFNQLHDGSYGAITSGLSEARSTGVKETGLASIPTDSASETSKPAETEKPAEKVYEGNESNGGDPFREWYKNNPDVSPGSGGNYMGGSWN